MTNLGLNKKNIFFPKTNLEKFGVFIYPYAKKTKNVKIKNSGEITNLLQKTKLGIFGVRVYHLLVENFPQTFFVGGMVRDLILHRKIADIDIATEATPAEVLKIFSDNHINADKKGEKFGNITAKQGGLGIEVTTFRKDRLGEGRYPKVKFIKSAKIDSLRRDFTINSLYLSLKRNQILDSHSGQKDLARRLIRFIGKPETKVKQDPLRIIRALRFALALNFQMDFQTLRAIKNNFSLIKNLTESRIKSEIVKIKNSKHQKILKAILINPKLLDKYFK